eukprot:g2550.t1
MASVSDLPLLPNALRKIKPYLQRAKETESKFPIVAFYACKYAATLGTDLVRGPAQGDKESTKFILALLDGLEAKKGSIQLTDKEAEEQILGFAMKIFKKADDKYRLGTADKSTGRALYAAGNFLTTLKQFGPLEKRVDGVRKYALLSAARILKALKQGRVPVAPSLEDDENDESTKSSGVSKSNDPALFPGNGGSGGILDIPAAPGFEDSDRPATNGGGEGGGGGFLDIPAAPGFEDDATTSVGGGGGGFLDIPAAPGFEDDATTGGGGGGGGFLDIPAAPGFEDDATTSGGGGGGGLPSVPTADESEVDKAERLRKEADAFFANNQAKRALGSYLNALDFFMAALKKTDKKDPVYQALFKKIDLMMRNAEKMKGMLKLVPNIANKLEATLAPLLKISSFVDPKSREGSTILAHAVAEDKEEHYVAAQRLYKDSLTKFMQGQKQESADVRKVVFSKLGLVMSRAEVLKNSGF